MSNWIACDRMGEPLATVKADTQEQAEALALRKVVGVDRMVEVKSLSRRDLENRLQTAFKQLGYSEATAKTMAARTNVKTLRAYEAESSHEATSAFVERQTNPEGLLFKAFRSIGMSEHDARIAAEKE